MKTRLFACNHQGCNRSFRDEESQIKHSLAHSPEGNHGKRKLVCGKCFRNFSTKQSLREHFYTHSGKKTFKCQELGCGKAFRQSSQLCNHRKVHRLHKNLNLYEKMDSAKVISNDENIGQSSCTELRIDLPPIKIEKIVVKLPNFMTFFSYRSL